MKIIFIFLIIAAVVCIIGAHLYFNFAITREIHPLPGQKKQMVMDSWSKYKERMDRDAAWDKEQSMEDVWITSSDGLRLHARFFPAEGQAARAVICCHGYHGHPFMDFCSSIPWLHSEGCDLLLIDERASGDSEGDYITYGARESDDIRLWAVYLDNRMKGGEPIYLYGISMGCSSVEITASLALPVSVKGVIADCGYTSMIDMLQDASIRIMHVPAYPLIWFMDIECRLRAKFAMREADANTALHKAKIPVLFIHGTSDRFVLPENSQRNYEACTAPKQLLLIPNAAHACSYLEDSESYQNGIIAFFKWHE